MYIYVDFRMMGEGNQFSTPKKKKKSPHPATFVRRSPRLMEKYKLPFSCASTDPISLSDDEVEMDLSRDASPAKDETIDLPRDESSARVENMDLVEVEREFVSSEKQTQTQFTMHDFDLLFPMSELISGGFSQLTSSGVFQLINMGVEGGEPNVGVDFPLATESPYRFLGLTI